GCYNLTSFELEIGRPLQLTTPAPLTLCDDALPNDGVRVFNLRDREDAILGPFGVGQGYIVTYYESQSALNNENPIANPEAWQNPSGPGGNPKTLFVKVTSPEGCRSYTTLTIRVLPLPRPDTTPDALELCDLGSDGTENFNLGLAAADIRDNDNTVVLSYHTTAQDAANDTNAIANFTSYPSGSATIYVRVEANTNNPSDPVCYQVVTLNLVLNPLPVLGNAGVIPPLAQCQVNYTGVHTFLLNSHNAAVLGSQGPSGYTVRYYASQANAQAGSPALANQYTNTTPLSDVLWVRVDNTATGCFAIGSFRVLVERSAIANEPSNAPFQVCDTQGANDGFMTFDLTQAAAQVLGTQDPAQYEIKYYTSEADANAGVNAIADPTAYTNDSLTDTVWVRVTNISTTTRCYALATIDIVVEIRPEPEISTEGGLNALCFDYGSTTPVAPLVLSSGIDTPGYTFQWYLDGVAIAGATGASHGAVREGSYRVVAFGPGPRNCESDLSAAFEVIKSGKASIAAGSIGYTVSNAFSDSQTITVTVVGYGNYEYQLGLGGVWQDSNVFTDVRAIAGGYTITVRDKNSGGCDDLVIEDVKVIDYPRFFTPNGDGYNDRWNIIGLDTALNADAKIYIFDRYGKLVKQISSGG
ncbi:hypothetical protein CHU92_03760, partial [Flavobacterium cyanobacteriorum]